jgi:hypothetical protein
LPLLMTLIKMVSFTLDPLLLPRLHDATIFGVKFISTYLSDTCKTNPLNLRARPIPLAQRACFSVL